MSKIFEYCKEGKIKEVRALIEAGADVNTENNNGNTALMMASLNGHLEIVKILIEAGADVYATDNKGDTALVWASRKGHSKIVKRLGSKMFSTPTPIKKVDSLSVAWEKYNIPEIKTAEELKSSSLIHLITLTLIGVAVGTIWGAIFGAAIGGMSSEEIVVVSLLIGCIGAIIGGGIVGGFFAVFLSVAFAILGAMGGLSLGFMVIMMGGGDGFSFLGAIGVCSVLGAIIGVIISSDGRARGKYATEQDMVSSYINYLSKMFSVGNKIGGSILWQKMSSTQKKEWLQEQITEKDYTNIAYILSIDPHVYDDLIPSYIKKNNSMVAVLLELGADQKIFKDSDILNNAPSAIKAHLQSVFVTQDLSHKDFSSVKSRLQNGAKLPQEECTTIFKQGIKEKDWELITACLPHMDIFTQNEIDPLVIGVYTDNLDIITKAINKGHDIYQTWDNKNIFERVLAKQNKDIIRAFIQAHGDINKTLPSGASIMHLGAKYNLDWLIQENLAKKYDPNTLDHKRFTLLDYAVDYGSVEAGLLLIDNDGFVTPQ